MADIPVSQEEQALRRRARRRLVGAIALALLAVVVLPMLFDPEPKPLGGNVEIHIPGPDTPFESAPPGLAPAAEPLPAEANPSASATLVEQPQSLEKPLSEKASKPAPVKPVVSMPAPSKPAQPPKLAETKPAATKAIEAKPAEIKSSESKPPVETKSAKPSAAPAAGGVYLQLGVFSSASNARQLADKAKAAGFPASVVSGGSQNKVRVGPYDERAQAVAAQAKLKTKGINSVLSGP